MPSTLVSSNICTYTLAIFFGSTLALFWKKTFFNNYQMYYFAVAAGFIAGEGPGGMVKAIFTTGGVSGAVYGTSISCPGGVYCGYIMVACVGNYNYWLSPHIRVVT
ncbi:hypothetical protein PAXRUDRAFT_470707 [Paxillus rubicundulus Ve08.2h10]|uniref:Uncharacterized protein n=1 Tax=Paxillus rubicundulus Ve08.2h10 TaxID=930991 RepID=A0A0D0CX89_9AGAM|nr:hypothetical protein PAXRUDRAFT_470707 [Paxillus rubicundulus Ve08.2h10]